MTFFSFQAFVASGTNLQLSFLSNAWSDRPEDRTPTREFVDFDREVGKVSLNYFLLHFDKILKFAFWWI